MPPKNGKRKGPNIDKQAFQDHSLTTGYKDNNRPREGRVNKRGVKAIEDVLRRPVGGKTIHHCGLCGSTDTARCIAKEHIIKCPECKEYISASYKTECWVCKAIEMAKAREDGDKKEEERARQAELKARQAEAEASRGKRKPRHSANEREKRALEQTAHHEANTRRQVERAQAIANFAFARRPVGVRKRTGRVGQRMLSGRAPIRPAHARRRHTISEVIVIDSSSSADEMDETEDEWEDVGAEEADAIADDEARRLRLEEDAELQRRISETLDRLRS